MSYLLPTVALFLSLVPTLISAQCAACDTYTAALKSCQTTSANVTAVGTKMDSTTIHCMCTAESGVTGMNACQACEESNPSDSLDLPVLLAWTTTCQADSQFGDQQATACWEGQPSNILPCVSTTGGSGSGGIDGGTTSGGDVAATSTTTLTHSASPTTSVKSDAIPPLQAPVLISFFILGVGIVIEL